MLKRAFLEETCAKLYVVRIDVQFFSVILKSCSNPEIGSKTNSVFHVRLSEVFLALALSFVHLI